MSNNKTLMIPKAAVCIQSAVATKNNVQVTLSRFTAKTCDDDWEWWY